MAWGTADAAGVALCAAGLLARSVPPHRAWGLQLVALGLPLAGAFVVAAAGGWVAAAVRHGRAGRGRRVPAGIGVACVVHLGLAVAVFARFGAPWPSSPVLRGERGAGAALRIMTLNAGAAGPSGPARLAETLAAERPHVVALQETSVFALIVPEGGEGAGSEALAYHPILQPLLTAEGYGPAPLAGEGAAHAVELPVFGRVRLLSYAEHVLGPPTDAGPGTYARTTFRWGGREVALYTVHLRSFSPSRPWRSGRVGEVRAWVEALHSFRASVVERAREVERLRSVLGAERLPYLVVGDFNSTPHQWTYAHLSRGLHDALAEGARSSRWTTATFPDRWSLVLIDGVLASPEWRVVGARVGSRGHSDHRPVVADVVLQTGEDGDA